MIGVRLSAESPEIWRFKWLISLVEEGAIGAIPASYSTRSSAKSITAKSASPAGLRAPRSFPSASASALLARSACDLARSFACSTTELERNSTRDLSTHACSSSHAVGAVINVVQPYRLNQARVHLQGRVCAPLYRAQVFCRELLHLKSHRGYHR